ncbi:MAG: hypothetical protein PHI12_14305 [Dehalococcoidales bacterium]|nr:hypothetical protein [Dehalococcoidales bacterium]
MTHDELVIRGCNWFKNNHISRLKFPIILTEYRSYADSRPDVLGMNHSHTAVIECKVARSDYFADLKKGHRQWLTQIGNRRFYLCPVGLLKADEITNGWGLLYCHPHKITIEKESDFFPPEQTRPQEYQIMYSILRRLMSFDGHDKTLDMLKGVGR